MLPGFHCMHHLGFVLRGKNWQFIEVIVAIGIDSLVLPAEIENICFFHSLVLGGKIEEHLWCWVARWKWQFIAPINATNADTGIAKAEAENFCRRLWCSLSLQSMPPSHLQSFRQSFVSPALRVATWLRRVRGGDRCFELEKR